jgi:hypothetical protein
MQGKSGFKNENKRADNDSDFIRINVLKIALALEFNAVRCAVSVSAICYTRPFGSLSSIWERQT